MKLPVTTPAVVLTLVLTPGALSQSATEDLRPRLTKGVIVESVSDRSEAAQAGVQVGDILLDWSRGEARGEINSPFDLPYLRYEQASRGVVTVGGLRANQRRTWRLGSDVWGIASRRKAVVTVPGDNFRSYSSFAWYARECAAGQAVRGTPESTGEIFRRANVGTYGILRIIATLEILQHHFSEAGKPSTAPTVHPLWRCLKSIPVM